MEGHLIEAKNNMQGQQILEDIMRNPGMKASPNKFGGQDYFDPTGRGAPFNQDGSFRGFWSQNHE